MIGGSSTSTEERGALVKEVMRFAKELGFDANDIAKTLGYPGQLEGNLEYLAYELVENRKVNDVEQRCDYLIRMDEVLRERFGLDCEAKKRCIKTQHSNFRGKSARTLLTSGKLSDLSVALAMVQNVAAL